MIIGLTGLKGSGKDTVGAYLIKEHGFEHRTFAGPLKRSFAALFDIPLSEIEKYKNDSACSVTVHTNYDIEHPLPGGGSIGHTQSYPHATMTFRKALQRYGTESHRDVFGEDFWVDQTLPVDGFYSGRAIVVTDVRFENEADRIHELNGFVIRIERPGVDLEDLHRSEAEQASLKVDTSIYNGSTIPDLYKSIEIALESLTNDTYL